MCGLQGLNKMTVRRSHFLIPLAEDLLDELEHASVFKLKILNRDTTRFRSEQKTQSIVFYSVTPRDTNLKLKV